MLEAHRLYLTLRLACRTSHPLSQQSSLILRAAPNASFWCEQMREMSPGRSLTVSGDYALMCVLHLARYGGKLACTSFEVAITLCRGSHEAHVHVATSRETANSCVSYAKPWQASIPVVMPCCMHSQYNHITSLLLRGPGIVPDRFHA